MGGKRFLIWDPFSVSLFYIQYLLIFMLVLCRVPRKLALWGASWTYLEGGYGRDKNLRCAETKLGCVLR